MVHVINLVLLYLVILLQLKYGPLTQLIYQIISIKLYTITLGRKVDQLPSPPIVCLSFEFRGHVDAPGRLAIILDMICSWPARVRLRSIIRHKQPLLLVNVLGNNFLRNCNN